jgi:hypothetical protein
MTSTPRSASSTRRFDVRDGAVQALDGACGRLRDPGIQVDRAGRPGRSQPDEARRVADPSVEVYDEAGLISVEGLGPVYVGYGNRHHFELPIHRVLPFRIDFIDDLAGECPAGGVDERAGMAPGDLGQLGELRVIRSASRFLSMPRKAASSMLASFGFTASFSGDTVSGTPEIQRSSEMTLRSCARRYARVGRWPVTTRRVAGVDAGQSRPVPRRSGRSAR